MDSIVGVDGGGDVRAEVGKTKMNSHLNDEDIQLRRTFCVSVVLPLILALHPLLEISLNYAPP